MSHDGKSITPEETYIPAPDFLEGSTVDVPYDDEPYYCTHCDGELFIQENYFIGDPEDENVGERYVPCPECNKDDWQNKKPCPECHGRNQCKTCDGEGKVHKTWKKKSWWKRWLKI